MFSGLRPPLVEVGEVNLHLFWLTCQCEDTTNAYMQIRAERAEEETYFDVVFLHMRCSQMERNEVDGAGDRSPCGGSLSPSSSPDRPGGDAGSLFVWLSVCIHTHY